MAYFTADQSSQLIQPDPDAQFLFVNNDSVNPVYISQDRSVNKVSDAIPAQGSVSLTGWWYASSLNAAADIQCFVFPGGSQWSNPVGVQIALNALGLAKDTSVNAPGYGPVSLTNPGQLAKDSSVGGISGQAWASSGLVKESGGILSTGIALPSGAARATDVAGISGQAWASSGLVKESGGILASGIALPVGAAQNAAVTALHSSGSTVAQEVAATGVGLLAFSQNVMNPGPITMTTGQIVSYGPSSFGQISYEIGVSLQGQTGDGSPWLAVNLEWSDAATGLIIRREIWQIGAATSANQVSLTGPAKGTRLKVTLHWYGGLSTATNGVQIVVNQTSRLYTRDDGRNIEGFSTYIGFTAANYDLDAGLVVSTAPSIGAGASATRSIPLYHGAVLVQLDNAPLAGNVAIMAVASADINGIVTEAVFAQTVAAAGNLNQVAYLPRSACTLQITNNGASTGQFVVNVFIAEQEL